MAVETMETVEIAETADTEVEEVETEADMEVIANATAAMAAVTQVGMAEDRALATAAGMVVVLLPTVDTIHLPPLKQLAHLGAQTLCKLPLQTMLKLTPSTTKTDRTHMLPMAATKRTARCTMSITRSNRLKLVNSLRHHPLTTRLLR